MTAIEPGNCVVLKALPSVKMIVMSLASYDDAGWQGDYRKCIWFDAQNRIQFAVLRVDWLELSGL